MLNQKKKKKKEEEEEEEILDFILFLLCYVCLKIIIKKREEDLDYTRPNPCLFQPTAGSFFLAHKWPHLSFGI
jgi:hypothetical protein